MSDLVRVRASGALATTAVLTAVAALLPAAAAAAPPTAELTFQAQTAATAVHVTLTQQPASSIITASLVDDAASYAAGAYDSGGGSEAQAASVFPGNLVVQGPALFCTQLFTCPVTPPDYPLLADASYPRRARAAAAANQQPLGSGAFVVTPAASTATAAADGNAGDTAAAGISVLHGAPAAVTVGAGSAHSEVRHAADGLTVHVESRVTDVDVAGLLHVDLVRAVDDITLRPGGRPVDAPHVTVSGATAGGVPVTIDETGVHVAGQHGGALPQRLAQAGVAVHLVGVDRQDTPTVARSDAGGLAIDLSLPVSGLPYVPNPLPAPFDQIPGVDANGTYLAHVTLGAAGAVAAASTAPGFDLGGVTLPGPVAPPPAASSGSGAVAGAGGSGPVVASGPGSTAPAPQLPDAARPVRGVLAGFGADLASLYAVLALGTATLFIGWRGTVALRRRHSVAGRPG